MVPTPGPRATAPSSLQGFFLPSADGDLWITRWSPAMPPRASVLILPAFTEEMNKCRPMQAMLGRRLAAQGLQTISVDLQGTGDSAGEFRDARTETWVRNLARVAQWAAETGAPLHGIVGIRFGALLLPALMTGLRAGQAAPLRVALWQPVASGDLLVRQFLRLRVAGDLLTGGGAESVASLLADLESGQLLEIAGYELSPGLASDLRSLDLRALVPASGSKLAWFEVGPDQGVGGDRGLSKMAEKHLGDWEALGLGVHGESLVGDAFWNTVELTSSPALVDRTVEFLAAATAGSPA